MNFGSIGLDWPYSATWLLAGALLYFTCLFLHSRKLFRTTTRAEAWKLSVLRGFSGAFFLLLVARPFIEHFEPNPDAVRVVSLVDLSGSMNEDDREAMVRRVDQVRPFLELERADSWINQMRDQYGTVDRLGFANDEVFAVRSTSWNIPAEGKNTFLGNALVHVLDSPDNEEPAAIVLFSDGRNNAGKSLLEAGDKFREYGIPVHVIGVGENRVSGNLSVEFKEIPSEVVAKEEFVITAEIQNGFEGKIKTSVRLFANDEELESLSLNLGAGESRTVRFAPHTPEIPGVRTYRVLVDSLEGDSDPSDDGDAQVVKVRPPAFFSVFYLSHRVMPLYPFLKRSLAGERFQLSSLIRLGSQTFHARGEGVSPEGYPQDPEFWMQYDAVLLDAGCLEELNASMVVSLKDFVHKRGGGLLLWGDPDPAQSLLGGLMPVLETQSALAKENLSLTVLPDPLFTERKRVDEWKPFLPAGMPAELITRMNPAARDVVSLKGGAGHSVLSLQAYGAGKSAYWGSPHDWKRPLSDEKHSHEFSLFWGGLVEWLGSGTVERIKAGDPGKEGSTGEESTLMLDVLGQDFEPSMDARVDANITGPDGFSKSLQLYPQGGMLGRYAGQFIPTAPGSYRVEYNLSYPDGEKLSHLSYLKIKKSGDEGKDTRYAERELQMLANLTGGEFLKIEKFQDDWVPSFSASLPTVQKKRNLDDFWLLFLALFLAAGTEWILRRKGGLR